MVVWNTVTITASAATGSTYIAMRGSKADVVSDASGQEVAACAQRSAKAVFLAYPVCVAQQRPGAPQGKHYRAEQIPQQLRRPGKGHGCDIFQQFSAPFAADTVGHAASGVLCEQQHTRQKSPGRTASRPRWCYGDYAAACATAFPAVLALAANRCRRSTPRHWNCAHSERSFWRRGCRTGLRSRLLLLCFIFSQRGFFSFLRAAGHFSGPEHNS